MVGAVRIDDSASAPLLRVLTSTDAEVPQRSRPIDLSVSSDRMLAVTTDVEGIHMLRLSKSGTPPSAKGVQILRPKVQNRLAPALTGCARWIGAASDNRALAVKFTDPGRREDIVQVFGHLGDGTDKLNVIRVMHTSDGGVSQFDACDPGRMAIVMGKERRLHLFRLREDDVFVHTPVDLRLHAPEGLSAINAYTCVTLALGDRLAAVAYCFPQKPGGVVDVFDTAGGSLIARRVVPDGIPTSLSTRGRQVLVAVSVWSSTPESKKGSSSVLYAFNAQSAANVGIYRGGETHPAWPARSICLRKGEWCYARTAYGGTSGKRITVIDHASCSSADL